MIQDQLNVVRERFPGAYSIVLSDKDGVEIVSSPPSVLSDFEARRNSQIVSTIFYLLDEQSQKLSDFGRTEYLISEYGDQSLLIQAKFSQVIMTCKADRMKMSDMDVIDLVHQTKSLLSDILEKLALIAQSYCNDTVFLLEY